MPLQVSATAAGSNSSRSFLLRIALMSIALLGGVAVSGDATPAQEIPAGAPQLVDSSGLSFYAHAHPYLEERLKHLVKQIPELETLRPAADQEMLPIILMHTGMKVGAFFRNIVDLAAREEIGQEILSPDGAVLASQQLRYNYLILLNGHESPPRYEEYRTDLHGSRAEQGGVEQGYAITAGFALKCIYFLPALRSDSTFRYLGDQMLGTRDTYVVAFAQVPAQATFWGTVTGEWGTVRILDQGIAWVDKSTFQIIRLRTDLLAAHNDIGLAQQTTEVTFSEVRIPDVATPLWLPSEANVYAKFQGHVFRNEHHYTNYERFRVSVKMDPPIAFRACSESHPTPP
jgi:hypothetical protein